VVRRIGFVDSAYALIGTLARIIISAVLNLTGVGALFAVKHPLQKLLPRKLFGLCNKPKSCSDNVTTCTPLEILELPDDALLNMMFS
jgi:hypothetical protein